MCCNFLCFIGLHKYVEVNILSAPKRINRRKRVRYTQKQCKRCCKLIQLEVYKGKTMKAKASDIMKCERCNREIDIAISTCTKPYRHDDGHVYSDTCSWSANYICPHCGYDNSPRVMMEEQ